MESPKLPNKKIKLLVIDDEPLMTELLSKFMIRLGFEVFSASSGQIALDSLASSEVQPDLVITDMSMPEMSGVEMARILASLRPNIPVVIATGFASSDELTKLPANVAAIVQKPYQYMIIANKIEEILESKFKSNAF